MTRSFTHGKPICYLAVRGRFVGQLFCGGSAQGQCWKDTFCENWTFSLASVEGSSVCIVDVDSHQVHNETRISAMERLLLHIDTPYFVL